ncbi:hypothetical protein GDR29_12605 [Xanthomonas oryzae pv. oryzae]|nr:hypothetical protein GDR29_12605 [Xanthomonas oryzae pv. oryzae]
MLRGETGTGCSGVGTLMLFACVGIVVLCAPGMVMWCGGASRPAASARLERATTRRIAGYSPWPWPPQPPSRSHWCSFSLLVVWTFDRWIRPRSPLFRWLD